MIRTFVAALSLLALSAGSLIAADEKNPSRKAASQPTPVTITQVDAKKGEIAVRYTDAQGKEHQKTFHLSRDVHYFDETGRVVNLDVFQSGQDALVVESEGRLRELRRAPHAPATQRLSDAVRTLIELTDCDEGCTAEVQRIYDMLHKLDTNKDGKIDPKELKAESNRIVEERVRGAFERLDLNHDGKISKDEAKGLIKEHFDRLDANKDGFIDHGELLQAAKERREARKAEARASEANPPRKEKQ